MLVTPSPQEFQVHHRLYSSKHSVKGRGQTLAYEQAQTDPISAGTLTTQTLKKRSSTPHEVKSLLFIPLCSFRDKNSIPPSTSPAQPKPRSHPPSLL